MAEARLREKKERRLEEGAEGRGGDMDEVLKLGAVQPSMIERIESWMIQAYLDKGGQTWMITGEMDVGRWVDTYLE